MNVQKLMQHQAEINTFVEKKFDEMRAEMGFAASGAVIGCSVDDSLQFDRIPPQRPAMLSGWYIDKSNTVNAEVLSYNPNNGLVVLAVPSPESEGVETDTTMIDYVLFAMLFDKAPDASLPIK